jgi:outer membrane protein OmpA-like peptidoglycan-associated protein
MTTKHPARVAGLLAIATLITGSGCATKGYVKEQVASLEGRVQPATQQAAADARNAQQLAQDAGNKSLAAQREAQLARDMALGHVKREEVRRATVNFEFNSAAVTEDAFSTLDAIAADLQSNPNYMALVTGYTDATGDEAYNISLAQRRAAAVQLYLAERLGPDFVRLATLGFGESSPVGDNTTREGRAANRRTDVILVRPAPSGTGGAESQTAARP